MILLDTNILSELMRSTPEPAVSHWLAALPNGSVFTSAITEAELRLGAALLPHGKRRSALTAQVEHMLDEEFLGRILPFDSLAAVEYASIASGRRKVGRAMSEMDAQIAAIARSRGASLATRNVSDFEGCGLSIVDPWLSH